MCICVMIGYNGNGVMCTFVGVCGVNNGGCHSLATCQEAPGFTFAMSSLFIWLLMTIRGCIVFDKKNIYSLIHDINELHYKNIFPIFTIILNRLS